ncbi:hypothetical protein FHX69_4832 [Prauserella muralis]|nr:hypothetical protein FHX69_4832 [Prauserella muralis]
MKATDSVGRARSVEAQLVWAHHRHPLALVVRTYG